MLTSLMPEGLAVFIECVVIGVCIVLMYAILAIILIYMERKVCAFFQCRLGPNRVGKYGSLQVFCDVFKMLTKEIFTPKGADRFLYNLAPYMVILASFLTFSCLPVNKGLEVLDFNVGIFFFLAASSIGVVGILLAGWSSNNKFALIGAMRSGAQIVSYELSVGMSLLTMTVLTGTLQISEIVSGQADGWLIFKGHIPAVIAFVTYLLASSGNADQGGTPIMLVIVGVLVFIYNFILTKTVFGRHVYAVGGNRKAAILSGINTRRVDFLLFVHMGFLSAVAAVCMLSRLASATAQAGMEFEMDAIAACFIGGTAVTGGIGTIPGAVIGAFVMGVINQGLSIMGVDTAVVKTIKGLVLLLAVAVDIMSKRKKS